jgi:hypothetical protein
LGEFGKEAGLVGRMHPHRHFFDVLFQTAIRVASQASSSVSSEAPTISWKMFPGMILLSCRTTLT